MQRSILSGKNTFVSLPSGYGYSLIHAALSLVCESAGQKRQYCSLCKSADIPHCCRFYHFRTLLLV